MTQAQKNKDMRVSAVVIAMALSTIFSFREYLRIATP
jgi:hypothetical protein